MVIDFEKEQLERKTWADRKLVPQILKEIILDLNRRNQKPTTYTSKFDRLAEGYEATQRQRDEVCVMELDRREKRLPNCLSESEGGDGKIPSGYKHNVGRGIRQII